MKLFILLLLLLSSVISSAGEIVLLTSLKLNEKNILHLEKKFQEAFRGSVHDLVIHHQADPKTLHKVLTSDETEALIWVSHAAGEHELKPGLMASDIILDIWGNDVKKFFTLAPKNIKFLGLVGCQAKLIIDGFRARDNYLNAPHLEIHSFEKKVSLYSAFDKTLKAAVGYLRAPRNMTANEAEQMINFQMERTAFDNSSSFQSGWVEIGDRVLALFDENQTSGEGAIDQRVFNKISRQNIRFFRDKSSAGVDESLGKLLIESSSQIGYWTLFAKDGKPVGGREEQLYLFKRKSSF